MWIVWARVVILCRFALLLTEMLNVVGLISDTFPRFIPSNNKFYILNSYLFSLKLMYSQMDLNSFNHRISLQCNSLTAIGFVKILMVIFVFKGSEFCKLMEVYFCELCKIYLPRLDDKERALTVHCRSRTHLQRYIRSRDDRNLRRKAVKLHKEREKLRVTSLKFSHLFFPIFDALFYLQIVVNRWLYSNLNFHL